MSFKSSCLLIALVAAGLAASPASAQQKKNDKAKTAEKAKATDKKAPAGPAGTFLIASYGDWGAYTSGKDKAKVCYALSQPKERTPKGLSRDPAYLFVSNRPGDGARNEFSVIMGYPLKAGSAATLTVGSANFTMLTKDKSAWLRNAAEEPQLIEAMKKGSALTIKGTSLKGNDTTDRYSLSGIGQAIDRAQKECP